MVYPRTVSFFESNQEFVDCSFLFFEEKKPLWETNDDEIEKQFELESSINFSDDEWVDSLNNALENGFDPYFRNGRILHTACRYNNFQMVKYLIEDLKLHANNRTDTGYLVEVSTLISAVFSENTDLIDYLIEKGCTDLYFALYTSIIQNRYNIARHLISKGVEVDKSSLNGALYSICHKKIPFSYDDCFPDNKAKKLEDIIEGIFFILWLIENDYNFNNIKKNSEFWNMKDQNNNVYPFWFKKLMEMDTLEEQQHWIFHQKHMIKFASCLEQIYGHPDLERTKTEQLDMLKKYGNVSLQN